MVAPSPRKVVDITLAKASSFKGFATGSAITSIVYSPNGEFLAATDKNTVRVWSVSEGVEVVQLTGAGGRVYSLAFSPDGKRLAGGCLDKTICIWDTSDWRLKTTIEGVDDRVTELSYSLDNTMIASSDNGLAATLWTSGGRRLQQLNRAKTFAFSPTEKTIAIVDDGAVSICRMPTGQKLFEIAESIKDARHARYSPDGQSLAVVHKSLDVLDLEKRKLKFSISLSRDVHSIAYSPDGALLAAGGHNAIMIWNARTGQELTKVPVSSVAWSVAFSPKGNKLACSASGAVDIWDILDKEP